MPHGFAVKVDDMNWSSWSEFIAMGGYAQYVWGSLGVVALLLVVEVAQLIVGTAAVRRSNSRPEHGG